MEKLWALKGCLVPGCYHESTTIDWRDPVSYLDEVDVSHPGRHEVSRCTADGRSPQPPYPPRNGFPMLPWFVSRCGRPRPRYRVRLHCRRQGLRRVSRGLPIRQEAAGMRSTTTMAREKGRRQTSTASPSGQPTSSPRTCVRIASTGRGRTPGGAHLKAGGLVRGVGHEGQPQWHRHHRR